MMRLDFDQFYISKRISSEIFQKFLMIHFFCISRQITASVTFLPLLESPCSFDVLIYTGKEADTPENWAETSACLIKGAEQVQLRSFSTAVHSVHTKVCYKPFS